MAQSVDLSIATVIEHVGKNCVPQTKSLLFRVRFPGRWKMTTSGMLENDPSRPQRTIRLLLTEIIDLSPSPWNSDINTFFQFTWNARQEY